MRGIIIFLATALSSFAAQPVTLHWLGDAAPTSPNGITWGVPWPKGAVTPDTPMRLTTADGRRLEVQTWPTCARWPRTSTPTAVFPVATST